MAAVNRLCRKNSSLGLYCSDNKGLTLIELLVTLTVLGFIIFAVYTFYLSGLKSFNRSIDHMEYQQSAHISLNKIIYELRYASEVEIRNHNNEMIYFRANYKGKSTLFRFRLSGNQLLFEQRKDNDTHYTYNVIALGITGMTFIIEDNKTVFVTIQAGDESKKVFLSGSVRPRNIPLEEVECD